MFSRTVIVGLLAGGCLTAAAAGALVATRQNSEPAVQVSSPEPSAAPPASQGAQPVAETETVVQPTESPAPAKVDSAPPKLESAPPVEAPARATERKTSPSAPPAAPPHRTATAAPAAAAPAPIAPPATSAPARRTPDEQSERRAAEPRATADAKTSTPDPARESAASIPAVEAMPRPDPAVPSKPAERQFEELILPSSSVIGLEVETSLTSERAQVEDRVDARVTRDVYVDGRLVIPSRSKMIGNVTLVDRGGKVKERARLGVRFHTLVLDDGRQVAVRTETIMREGEPPSNDSSRKIGGAAIGGAVLGAIIGGGKGAVLGGAAGAAGGTAAVMAGGRNPATLASGTVVTARLAGPVAIEVEKR
jgi:hypothetical protein